ncbi:hypothetical protein [Silanimonas sp.]|uniref:hypothetical protein n=1 Tax=Silanimonas sp. TaxID=1929290 RepID=UPI00260D8505|nr:hypothetical protein [Silanimonas sp.]
MRSLVRSLAISALLFVQGCSDPGEDRVRDPVVRTITGLGKICLPSGDYEPHIDFLPIRHEGPVSGISIGGCVRIPRPLKATCPFPAYVESTNVSSPNEAPHPLMAWGDIGYGQAWSSVSDPLKLARDTDSGYVVVQDAPLAGTWLVVDSAPTKGGGIDLRHDDPIVAKCVRYEGVVQAAGIGKPGQSDCRRSVVTGGYGLDYAFFSDRRVPTREEIEALDQGIVGALNAWRCD